MHGPAVLSVLLFYSCNADDLVYLIDCSHFTIRCFNTASFNTDDSSQQLYPLKARPLVYESFPVFLTSSHLLGPCDKVNCDYNGICVVNDDGKATCGCHKCGSAIAVRPICGNDGRTYPSKCHLMSAVCREKTEITATRMGPCSEFRILLCQLGKVAKLEGPISNLHD